MKVIKQEVVQTCSKNVVSVKDFEEEFYRVEKIRIIVRKSLKEKVPIYPFIRGAKKDQSLTKFVKQRLTCLTDNDIEFVIFDGLSRTPHGRTLLGTIRYSYKEKEEG